MLTRRVRTSHATARISSVSVCNYYFVLTAFIAGLQFHTTLHPFTSNHFPNCRTSRNQTLPNSSHHLPSKPHVYVRPQSPKTLPKTLGKNFRKFFTCRSTEVCHHRLARFSRGAQGTGLPRCRAALAREQQPLRPTGWYSAMPDALPRAALFLPSANILNKFQIYILGEWSCCSPPHACRPGDLSPALPAPQPTDEGNNAGRIPSQPPRSQPLAQPHSPHNHLPLLASQQPGGGLALAGGASLPHTLLLR